MENGTLVRLQHKGKRMIGWVENLPTTKSNELRVRINTPYTNEFGVKILFLTISSYFAKEIKN